MKQSTKKSFFRAAALALVLICCFATSAFAQEITYESATATGSYKHPLTGVIEDSGGESSEALGQSMVGNMVDSQALVETAPDGTYYLSLRFHLMSNISETQFSVQMPGETSWNPVSYESTAKGEDSEDMRIAIPSKDAVVRAECMVDAMGRKVIFFITVDQFAPGNAGSFAQMDEKPSSAVPGGNTVGLVTGGTGKVVQPPQEQAVAETVPAVTHAVIGSNVWIMFFVLVFCAQLLACMVFWGIKTWFERMLKQRSSASAGEPMQDTTAEEPDFTDDFDADFLDKNWEDDEYAAH